MLDRNGALYQQSLTSGAEEGYFHAMEDAFTEVLERGQRAGEFADTIDPRDLARVFVHTLQGLTLLHKVLRDPGTSRSVIQSTLRNNFV